MNGPEVDLALDRKALQAENTRLIALLESLSEEITLQRFPAGALYVVATPIGNLGDISIRALSVLEMVDAVACEDTRTTGQLMKRYGLSKPMIATHQHNEAEAAQKIIERLQRGERVAIVSDAGTPAISDPGTRVVDAVMSAGLSVIPIAGPSAVAAAISAFVAVCKFCTAVHKPMLLPFQDIKKGKCRLCVD